MRISLTVMVDERFYTGGGGIVVPDILELAFEPLKITEDRFLAAVLQEVNEEEARSVLVFRKNAAKDLSEAIAGLILEEMQKSDTLNGYPIERLAEES